jgi:hypothetical protein
MWPDTCTGGALGTLIGAVLFISVEKGFFWAATALDMLPILIAQKLCICDPIFRYIHSWSVRIADF